MTSDARISQLVFTQSVDYDRRRSAGRPGTAIGSVYRDDRCCYCYRSVKPSAPRLRLARDNSGEWWLIDATFDLSGEDWSQLSENKPIVLPIGSDCLRQHPEFRFALAQSEKIKLTKRQKQELEALAVKPRTTHNRRRDDDARASGCARVQNGLSKLGLVYFCDEDGIRRDRSVLEILISYGNPHPQCRITDKGRAALAQQTK